MQNSNFDLKMRNWKLQISSSFGLQNRRIAKHVISHYDLENTKP